MNFELKEMYEPMPNSPISYLTSNIGLTDTKINISNGDLLPNAPNLATIGLGEDGETVLYTAKSGNTLTVIRGFEGVNKAWNTGDPVARAVTAYDVNTLKSNIDKISNSLNGVTEGATKVEPSAINGNIKINGTETPIANPGEGFPTNSGKGMVGTSMKYTREDHVHPVNIGSVSDFNTAVTHGEYLVGSGTPIANAPYASGIFGKLIVRVSDGGTHDNASNWVWQNFYTAGNPNDPTKVYLRSKTNDGAWTSWVLTTNTPLMYAKECMPVGIVINPITLSLGHYYTEGTLSKANGWPVDKYEHFTIFITGLDLGGGIGYKVIQLTSASGEIFIKSQGYNAWTPWKTVSTVNTP